MRRSPLGERATLPTFGAIRQTGALELLGEKSSVEGLQPFQNGLPVIGILKSTAGNAVNLVRLKACTKHIVQIKIVKS